MNVDRLSHLAKCYAEGVTDGIHPQPQIINEMRRRRLQLQEHGSVQNMMYANAGIDVESIKPGMGATQLLWSDREPFTIVEIIRFKSGKNKGLVKGVIVQRDDYVRTDSNGMSEMQEYTYSPNPEAPKITVTLRKDGKWRSTSGGTFLIGRREKYSDPHF